MEISNNFNKKLKPSANNRVKKVSPFLGLLSVLTIGLIPINIFPSGGFQVADIFIVILISYFLITKSKLDKKIKRIICLLIPFVIWVQLVSGSYFLLIRQPGFLIIAINILYAFFMLYTFSHMWFEVLSLRSLSYIYIALIISIICVFSFKGAIEFAESRPAFSFNNPNQLGLYSLLFFSTIIILIQYKKDNNISNRIYFMIDIFSIIIVHYFALMSISRATMAAFIFLDLCLLKKMLSRDLFLPVASAFMLGMVLLIIINPHFIQERFESRGTDRFSEGAFKSRMENSVIRPLRDLQGLKLLVGVGHPRSSSGRDIRLDHGSGGQHRKFTICSAMCSGVLELLV
jgi:hypothetical protein